MIRTLFSKQLNDIFQSTHLKFIVMPWDLDLNFHLNNVRYLKLCNEARLVHIAKFGLLKILNREKAKFIIRSLDISYYKPLRLFEKFNLVTKILEIEESQILLEHSFWKGDELVAIVVCEATLISSIGKVDCKELLRRYFIV